MPTAPPVSSSNHPIRRPSLAARLVVRYRLGLVAMLATAAVAVLLLAGCGSGSTTEAVGPADDRSDRRITSEAVEVTESSTLVANVERTAPTPPTHATIVDTTAEVAAKPANLVASIDDFRWKLDDNPFRADWSDERKEAWRRSLYIHTRFEALQIFVETGQLGDDQVEPVVGPAPDPVESYEAGLQYFVDIYNHADEIEVLPVDGQPPHTLGHWFEQIDTLAQTTYEQMSLYTK